MHAMGDGRRGAEAPRNMQVFKAVIATNEDRHVALFDADGRVAVRNEAGALRWMVLADADDLYESTRPPIG
jgi:hypothetical protein